MKIANNYPSIFQVPFPKNRVNINGKLFFKYRQKFRNKTIYNGNMRKLLSVPVTNLFTGRLPQRLPNGPVIRMRRIN